MYIYIYRERERKRERDILPMAYCLLIAYCVPVGFLGGGTGSSSSDSSCSDAELDCALELS